MQVTKRSAICGARIRNDSENRNPKRLEYIMQPVEWSRDFVAGHTSLLTWCSWLPTAELLVNEVSHSVYSERNRGGGCHLRTTRHFIRMVNK